MEKERTFHQQVRVVYRACRKIYGKEKTQDECLRVFKVVFPEILRLKESENERETLDESIRPALLEIANSWHPTKRLKELIERTENLIGFPFDYERQELIDLLEDITPVAMRIRKLSPKECYRLMDVDDKYIELLFGCGIAKSSHYKLAGNSVVVSCYYHILRKLLIDTEPEYSPGEQLTLF